MYKSGANNNGIIKRSLKVKRSVLLNRKQLIGCDLNQLRNLYLKMCGEELSNKIGVNEAVGLLVSAAVTISNKEIINNLKGAV